jgi:hypothetical protein
MFGLFKKREVTVTPQPDWAELRLQCIENILYLRAHINVLNSNIEHIKATSSRIGRAKIEKLTCTRNWMLAKLEEEQVDLGLFKQKLALIFTGQSK